MSNQQSTRSITWRNVYDDVVASEPAQEDPGGFGMCMPSRHLLTGFMARKASRPLLVTRQMALDEIERVNHCAVLAVEAQPGALIVVCQYNLSRTVFAITWCTDGRRAFWQHHAERLVTRRVGAPLPMPAVDTSAVPLIAPPVAPPVAPPAAPRATPPVHVGDLTHQGRVLHFMLETV
jgi:hypothetical protein